MVSVAGVATGFDRGRPGGLPLAFGTVANADSAKRHF
jgi:hypothetical protein